MQVDEDSDADQEVMEDWAAMPRNLTQNSKIRTTFLSIFGFQ